ncbi:MAG TPA: hypothetical protein VL244_07420 [Alphaproteobacteria bacterium]|nr:hypothetical protein [Alphaproteobacteria bacterium]
MRIGIVVGMAAEAAEAAAPSAALAASLRPLVFVAGRRPGRAQEGARQLLAQGAAALLSFGVAGGLDPTLKPGDAVLASAVTAPDGMAIETDPNWRRRLERQLAGRAREGAIAGADRMIATRAEKAALARTSRALAVDMESHQVARAAAAAGVPFMALRVIVDGAERDLPRAALAGLAPDGTTRPFAVVARLLLRPWELPRLAALAGDSRRALAALGRLAADLGPAFGLLV